MNISKSNLVIAFLAFVFFLGQGCTKMGGKDNSVKFRQYMVQGMTLYRQHCANCHQEDGTGLAKLVPPLQDSDYLRSLKSEDLACQIRLGLEGEIKVNGVSFNQPMPGIPQLRAIEIAEIITYVNNTWGREEGIYEVKEAEKVLNACEIQ